mmetsp:Transcript_14661/g.50046  ORF Transcript_14661/g.50046 Transcript_14661/m.50046 type:complete len:549 (-) Transcript_14661:319-1965(-)
MTEMQSKQGMSIDEALDRIDLGRGQIFSIATMCLLWIGEGMQIFIFFYLPKALNDDWGTPADDVAWIDGAMFLGVAIGALIGGYTGDAYGRRPTLLFFVGLSVISGLFCWWFAQSFIHLLLVRFVVGVGAGGFAPVSLSLTLEACPSRYRGRVALAVPGFAGALGRVLTAALAEALYDTSYNPHYARFNWRGCIVICTIPFILGFCLGVYAISESARWLLVKGRGEEASDGLHNLALRNGTADEFPKGTQLRKVECDELEAMDDVSWHRLFMEPLLTPLLLTSISHLCIAIAYFGMIFSLPVYLDVYGAAHGWTEEQKDLILVIVAVSEVPALMIAMWTIEIYGIGRRYTVIASMIGCGISCIIFNFHVVATALNNTYALVIPNFLGRGFAAAALITGNVYMAEMFPTGTRAAAASISRASGQVGAALAPIAAGFLLVDYRQGDYGMWTKLQPLRVYVLFSIFSFLGAFLFYELGAETAGRHLANTQQESMEQIEEAPDKSELRLSSTIKEILGDKNQATDSEKEGLLKDLPTKEAGDEGWQAKPYQY